MQGPQDPSPLASQLLSHPSDSPSLSLHSIPITASELPQIFSFLYANPAISELSLHSISSDPSLFSANSFKLLETPLTSLTKLSFEACSLSKSLDFLPVFLDKLPSLSALRLISCGLCDEDCEILCKVLKQCPENLVSLDLSRNKIKSLGANQLVLALQINTRLKELTLFANEGVDSRTSSDLQRLLQRNRSITSEKHEDFSLLPQEKHRNIEQLAAGQRLLAEDKERELLRLREVSQRNDSIKSELLLKHSALLQEQALLKAEELALQQEFQLVSQNKGFSEESLACRLESGRLQEAQVSLKQEEEFLRKTHEFSIEFEESQQVSAIKYAKIVEDYTFLKNLKEELDSSVLALKEETLQLCVETEERMQNFQEKFLQQSAKVFEKTRAARENQLLSLRNERKYEESRGFELRKELQKREERQLQKFLENSRGVFKEKHKINEFHHKLSEKTLEIEKKRVTLISADEGLRVAGVFFEETRRDKEIAKERRIYEKSLAEDAFFNEESLVSQEIAQLQARLAEIQTLVQRKVAENVRIREEYVVFVNEIKSNCARTLRNVVKPEFY